MRVYYFGYVYLLDSKKGSKVTAVFTRVRCKNAYRMKPFWRFKNGETTRLTPLWSRFYDGLWRDTTAYICVRSVLFEFGSNIIYSKLDCKTKIGYFILWHIGCHIGPNFAYCNFQGLNIAGHGVSTWCFIHLDVLNHFNYVF